MEPPSSTLESNLLMGALLLLSLLLYLILLLASHSFASISDFSHIHKKRIRQVKYFTANPQLFLGTVLQFSLISKLLIIFSLASLILNFWVTTLLSLVLLYSLNELVTMVVKGRELKIFQSTIYFTILLSAIAAPFNRLLISVTTMPQEEREEREEREVMSLDEIAEQPLLKNIVSLSNKSVHDIMTPRVDVVGVNTNMSTSDVMEVAIKCGYSRLPVYNESLDNVTGFLYVKDLVDYLKEKNLNYDWKRHIREVYFVPASKRIGDLLEEFRQKKIHLALVADEYGGTDGIVTLEDVLEEIVGEISDESDKTD